jgi:hypothetical protein
MNKTNIAVIGAFLMEGIRDCDYEGVLQKWDQGALELVQEIAHFAGLLECLYRVGFEHNPETCGVFDYEVTNEVGRWFAAHVRQTGESPGNTAIVAKIEAETNKFFAADDHASDELEQNAALKGKVYNTIQSWLVEEDPEPIRVLKQALTNSMTLINAWWCNRHGEYLELLSKYAGTPYEQDAVMVAKKEQMRLADELRNNVPDLLATKMIVR